MSAKSTEPRGLRVAVSGAAGGIGTALVEHLLGAQCRVAACDLSLANWQLRNHPQIHGFEVDFNDWEAIGRMVEDAVTALGGLDAVVSNAAVVDTLHRAERFNQSDWGKDLGVNLTGAFRFAQAAFSAVKESSGGSVVLVSSVAARLGQPGQVAYAASKAGLLGLVSTLAVEWAPYGITCNVVMPGMVETPKVESLELEVRDEYLQRIPMRRFAEPGEIAGTIAFLLSQAARYITGTVISVDGGFGLNGLSLSRRR